MTFDRLYEIVHGLSGNQRNHFTRFIGKEGKSKRYYLLYKRILKTESLDDSTEAKVRGKEFRDAAYYARYRTVLLDKILLSMASQQNEVMASNAYFENAISFGAFDLAWKSLKRRMDRAVENEEYFELQACYARLRETRSAYRTDWKIPGGMPSLAVVRRTCDQITDLEMLNERVVKGLQSGEGFVVGDDVLQRLERMEMVTSRERYLLMGLRTKVCFLKQDYVGALANQINLVDSVFEGEGPSKFIPSVRELILLIKLGLVVREEKITFKYNNMFQNLEPRTRFEKEFLHSARAETSVTVAYNFWNLNLIEFSYNELLKTLNSLDTQSQITLQYYCGVSFFYHGKFQEAQKAMLRLRNEYSKSKLEKYYWAVNVVLILSYYELKSVDILENLIYNSEREFRRKKMEYPGMIIQTVKLLLKNPINKNVILEDSLQKIREFHLGGDHQNLSNFFDHTVWINQHLGKGDMISLLKKEGAKPTFTNLANSNYN